MLVVERFFFRLGCTIGQKPLPFLLAPIILTVFSIAGVTKFKVADDIWDLYAPLDARSRIEQKATNAFPPIAHIGYYRATVFVSRRDGAQALLNPSLIANIQDVNSIIEQNMTVFYKGRRYSYADICGELCDRKNGDLLHALNLFSQNPGNPNIELKFPTAIALKIKFFLGYSMAGLSVDPRGKITNASTVILNYAVENKSKKNRVISELFDRSLRNFLRNTERENVHLLYSIHTPYLDVEEQDQVPISSLPYLAGTILFLGTFAMCTVFRFPIHESQHWEAFFGLISPGMAFISTLGLLWLCGYPYANILTAVPFLVMVVGVDDCFLILAGWRHSNNNQRTHIRLGRALEKSGTSVTVTSLTDVLCFGIGTLSPMPAVRLFCIYTAVALAVDFLYQITFFAAVVAYGGRRKELQQQSLSDCSQPSSADSSPVSSLKHFNKNVHDSSVEQKENLHTMEAENNHSPTASSKTIGLDNLARWAEVSKRAQVSKPAVKKKTVSMVVFTPVVGMESLATWAEIPPRNTSQQFGSQSSYYDPNSGNLSVKTKTLFKNHTSRFKMDKLARTDSFQTLLKWKLNLLGRNSLELSSESSDQRTKRHERLVGEFFAAKLTRLCALLLTVVHVLLALWSCSRISQEFTLRKLYLDSSELNRVSALTEQFTFQDSMTVSFMLRELPNFSDPIVRRRFLHMVRRLETIPEHSLPRSTGTRLWLREYQKYEKFFNEQRFWDARYIVNNFQKFDNSSMYYFDLGSNNIINGFYWTVTYRSLSGYRDCQKLLAIRRAILASYPEFKVLSHQFFDTPADVMTSIPSKLLQTMGWALICMALLIFLFIQDIRATFWVVLSMLSISSGTIGYLALWGVDLDGISLISILMSVGFSVDYSAHVCYHYFTLDRDAKNAERERKSADSNSKKAESERKSAESELKSADIDSKSAESESRSADNNSTSSTVLNEESAVEMNSKLKHTLSAVGFPVMQAILSTVIGMLPLSFVHSYVVLVFVKTVLVVNFLGLLHALFLLPCAFLSFNSDHLNSQRKIRCSQHAQFDSRKSFSDYFLIYFLNVSNAVKTYVFRKKVNSKVAPV